MVGRSSKYFENSRNRCCEGFYATGGGFGRAFCLYNEKEENGKEKEEEREEEREEEEKSEDAKESSHCSSRRVRRRWRRWRR